MNAPTGDRKRVRITDVAPRDGLQNEPNTVPTPDKAQLVHALAHARVDELEVTSFVSPKWIPQLADADDLFQRIIPDLEHIPHAGRPLLSALVPNGRGFERALAVHESLQSRNLGPLKIALFTAASETFSQRNTNASIAQTFERFRAFTDRAIDARMPIRLYISCAVACPFTGEVPPADVLRVLDHAQTIFDNTALDSLDIDLADTIGVATPHHIERLIDTLDPYTIPRCTIHLHDTFGRAADCIRAALAKGIRSFDGSAGGLGGCPYAATDDTPAPGNVATGTVVESVTAAGFTTNVDRAKLAEASDLAQRITRNAQTNTTDA